MKRLGVLLTFLLLAALFHCAPHTARAQEEPAQEGPLAMKSVPALYNMLTQVPDWLNTSRPLMAEDLRGRVLLVDFWTYCCVNCLHVIPKLQELEKEFGNRLAVIGVHSAKFANESDTENIRQAIQKYDIDHPVVNDADFLIWNDFGINAWPTLLLIGPDGLIKEVYRGEGDLGQMRQDITAVLEKNAGKVVASPLPIALEKNKEPQTVLRFPTKIDLKDANTLVIADSGHNRIVLADISRKAITHVIGNGKAGFADGKLDMAQFDHPQGVLADGDQIFVVDTGNHRLRLIDLQKGEVSTLAGTGARGGTFHGSAKAQRTALASPWDLAFYPDRNTILIANAGTHQLWSYDRLTQRLSIVAGNGRELMDDGALPFNTLAQPSGLSVSGNTVYFVDAETSSLRMLKDGKVTTLIGIGLFDFGLMDGEIDKALMQHPLGVYADGGDVYIADSYNHKIRRFVDGTLSTLDIDGLREPNDILKHGDIFYIADTNNHRIAMMDDDGDEVGILTLTPPVKPLVETYQANLPNAFDYGIYKVSPETIVKFDLAKGWHINKDGPSFLTLFDKNKVPVARFDKSKLADGHVVLPVLHEGDLFYLQGTIYYCEDKDSTQCLIRSVNAQLQVSNPSMTQSTVLLSLPN